jgi:hypothetical protein
MATRSTISIKTKTGFKTIYCHWDGYPSNNGRLLLDYYNSPEKANELILLGDLSSLREKIHPDPNQRHDFEHPQPDVCIYYGRDRGEKDTEPQQVSRAEKFPDRWQDYDYMYDGEQWKYREAGKTRWSKLTLKVTSKA